MNYNQAIEEAQKAQIERVDIIALERDEYNDTLNSIMNELKDQIVYYDKPKSDNSDTFQLMGVCFTKIL